MLLQLIKQGVDKKVEVYYEQIFKLANYLQHKVDDNLLNTFFHVGLIPYLQVANARMKRDTLFEHKEVVVTYLWRKHGWHKQLLQIPATKNWKNWNEWTWPMYMVKKTNHTKKHCQWKSQQ